MANAQTFFMLLILLVFIGVGMASISAISVQRVKEGVDAERYDSPECYKWNINSSMADTSPNVWQIISDPCFNNVPWVIGLLMLPIIAVIARIVISVSG